MMRQDGQWPDMTLGDIGDNHKVKLGKMASGLWVSPRALAMVLRRAVLGSENIDTCVFRP